MYTGSGTPAAGLDSQQSMMTELYIANVTLLVGDVVFEVVANGRADKSLVLADQARLLGVVVGGRRTFGSALETDIDIGEQAAQSGEEVLVAWGGIVKVLADAVIANGDRVAAATATTAGRVKTSVATNFVVGLALNAAAAPAAVVRVLLGLTRTAMT